MAAGERARHFSMIRDFHVADFITLGNAACGVGGVFCAMVYMATQQLPYFFWAAALAPLAFIFDVLDGKVARARNEHSTLGRELDSLADVISFGMAPAALGFAAGLRGGWDWAILIFFVCCGVSRLARFNVTAEKLSEGSDSGKVKYFEGTPIPTSVVLVGVLAFAAGLRGGWDALLLIYFVCCGISRLARYNVSASAAAAAATRVKFFEGFPIPTSLALVALLALFAALGRWQERLPLGAFELAGLTFHPLSLLYAVHGSAMISKTLRIPKP